ncbi:hypothetical protein RHMOL_Rhmol10G0098600 [Rhododendron molle]|uniref:Uncharacterized protein n=1 Tax=Rhododendron molle TaxID=49168 RepID=A0ACC0M1S8_RHOML|nr:hypothetical protein RHMOL_Rhmol10G0098600 [Rhododendron molle]
MGLGAILDPRYKMVLPGFCFPMIYNDPLPKVSQLKDSLYELYSEYVAMHSQAYNEQISQQSTIEVGSLNSASLGKKVVTCRSKYESFVRQSNSIQLVKSDFNIYLEERVYICQQGMDSQFDALEWWKANSLKYRVLSKMARDILSIPITSVASESTFSAGSRVILIVHHWLRKMLKCYFVGLIGTPIGSTTSNDNPTALANHFSTLADHRNTFPTTGKLQLCSNLPGLFRFALEIDYF